MKDVDFLNQVQLITAKPVVYLVNLPEKMYIKKKSKWLPKVCLSVNPLQPWVQDAAIAVPLLHCGWHTKLSVTSLPGSKGSANYTTQDIGIMLAFYEFALHTGSR